MKILIAALPIIFMIHDFEEIIMMKLWLSKNSVELKERFPKVARFMAKKGLLNFSTSAFSVAVLFEFIFISAITLLSLRFEYYSWWFAAFMAYFIHLFMHIGQWIIYKKYIPAIITSFLTLPYCIYTFYKFLFFSRIGIITIIFWTIIGILLAILALLIAFYLAGIFHRWEKINTK